MFFRILQVVENMERETGIGPATNSLEGCDSTIELLPHSNRAFRILAARPNGTTQHVGHRVLYKGCGVDPALDENKSEGKSAASFSSRA